MVESLTRTHHIPGAQVAIHHNGRWLSVEVGEVEHGSGRKVTRDVAFPAGSIGKSFTATVAMALIADGDLELDEPVGKYLPDLDPDSTGGRLTLRQLLSHTSGLESSPETDRRSATSLRRYVLEHCHRPELVQTPGTAFSYSNTGYILTGYLIEHITGMSWWDAVKSIVLRPLGIEPAFVVEPEPRTTGRPIATGHAGAAEIGTIRPVEQAMELAEAPAGALALSAVDLATFGLVHSDGEGAPSLLPAEYAEQMRESVPGAEPFGVADGWGLGLALFREDAGEWVGHDGTGHGTWSHLRVDPANATVVAVTTNASTGLRLWDDLVTELRRMGVDVAQGAGLDVPETTTPTPPGCAGTYLNGDIEYLVTVDAMGAVCLTIDAEPYAWLTFHDGLKFSLQEIDSGQRMYAGRFLRDPATGELDRIQVSGRLARRRKRAVA
jgi:CubicO group peptidase (beta-lactamase class C family)